MWARFGRLVVTAFAAVIGLGVGWVAGVIGHLAEQPGTYPFLAETAPLPHHVPSHRGGLSFRFAMAHDVIHERFPRHGPLHYRERNRLTREKQAQLSPDDPTSFPLCDDLGAGLDRLGRPDEAVVVMRAKLDRQQARGLTGRDLYTSYANLGTFLIHASFPKAIAGDQTARKQFREGVVLIRKSVEVNPEAHFGREQWQAGIAEFLLAAMDRPELVKTFDCLGNRLDLDIERILNREANWVQTGHGRPTDAEFSQGEAATTFPAFFQPGIQPDDPARWQEFHPIRKHITKVGAEDGWEALPIPSHRKPVPFDEPMLGIIGMWRQGGGANPHFSLALGETMLRVGQRYIAWAAYERAGRMADRYWPDPEVRRFLLNHCRKRQEQIEETLKFKQPRRARRPAWQHVSPPPSLETVEGLRSAFDADLARGMGYQKEYQKFEQDRLAAGVPLNAPGFFDAFLAQREPIASASGPEEQFFHVPRAKMYEYTASRRGAFAMVGAGLAALAAALLSRWWSGREPANPA